MVGPSSGLAGTDASAARITCPENQPLRARRLGCLRPQQDVVAEMVEAAEELADSALARLLVQERLPELAERHPSRQHVVGRDQDLVGDRHGGAQPAAPRRAFRRWYLSR